MQKKILKFVKNWLPVIAWMSVIFFLSHQPDLKSGFPNLIDFILRKLAHITEYAILCFLLIRATKNKKAAFVIAFLYACSDEFHQTFIFGRHGTLRDIGIDSIGIILAYLFYKNVSIEQRSKFFYNSKRVKKMRQYNHETVKTYVLDKIDFIKKDIELAPMTSVLEIGSGKGYFSYYLDKHCKLTATDVNSEILSLNPVANKQICDAAKLPFKNDSFDLVVAFNVLHHMNNPQIAVNEAQRTSKKYVVLLEPNADNLALKVISLFLPREWGTFRFTTKYFKRIIKHSNLKIIKFERIGKLLTPHSPLPLSLHRKMPRSFSPQLNLFNIAICKKI